MVVVIENRSKTKNENGISDGKYPSTKIEYRRLLERIQSGLLKI
jgi:hypothetical protein